MKLKYFTILFSIMGIMLLYLLSIIVQPQIINIDEISKFEGKQIITQGFVKNYQSTKSGSQIIEIVNNNSTVKVFVEGITDVEYGDLIKVTGEVQKYKEEWEIVVSDTRLIEIFKKWSNISVPIWQLAKNPVRYVGTNVNVTGFIDDVYENYFYLADLEEEYSIIIFYDSLNVSLFSGQKVYVLGSFLFNEKTFRYKIEINQEEHGVCLSKER